MLYRLSSKGTYTETTQDNQPRLQSAVRGLAVVFVFRGNHAACGRVGLYMLDDILVVHVSLLFFLFFYYIHTVAKGGG